MSNSNLLGKCCLLGEAVAGDPTHFMIERAFAQLGLDWRFLSFEVAGNRLGDALAGTDALGFQGVRLLGRHCDQLIEVDRLRNTPSPERASPEEEEDEEANLTEPLRLTTRARRTERITHLTRHEDRLQGDDATGPALVEALQACGDPAGKRVVLLGTEGAAPSVADVLLERGAASVAIADLAAGQAALFAKRLRSRQERPAVVAEVTSTAVALPEPIVPTEILELAWEKKWIELPEETDWVIATSCWPIAQNARVVKTLSPELLDRHVVIDLAIGSNRSNLLLSADDCGATTLDGLPVLVCETALAVEAWTGLSVDRGILRDAAEEFLGV